MVSLLLPSLNITVCTEQKHRNSLINVQKAREEKIENLINQSYVYIADIILNIFNDYYCVFTTIRYIMLTKNKINKGIIKQKT